MGLNLREMLLASWMWLFLFLPHITVGFLVFGKGGVIDIMI